MSCRQSLSPVTSRHWPPSASVWRATVASRSSASYPATAKYGNSQRRQKALNIGDLGLQIVGHFGPIGLVLVVQPVPKRRAGKIECAEQSNRVECGPAFPRYLGRNHGLPPPAGRRGWSSPAERGTPGRSATGHRPPDPFVHVSRMKRCSAAELPPDGPGGRRCCCGRFVLGSSKPASRCCRCFSVIDSAFFVAQTRQCGAVAASTGRWRTSFSGEEIIRPPASARSRPGKQQHSAT